MTFADRGRLADAPRGSFDSNNHSVSSARRYVGMVGSFLIGGATSCDERGQRGEEIEQRGDDREEPNDGLHEAAGCFFLNAGSRPPWPLLYWKT